VAEDRDRAFDGSSEVENPMQERTQIAVPLLTFDVRVTELFGIQAAASVPDVTRSAVVQRPAGAARFSETFSGLGDTSLVGWYKLAQVRGWFPVVNFGTSIPTGRTETPRFRDELEDGSLVPMSRLQRGTGTVDPLIGTNGCIGRNERRRCAGTRASSHHWIDAARLASSPAGHLWRHKGARRRW
jgi:hypothetical protein